MDKDKDKAILLKFFKKNFKKSNVSYKLNMDKDKLYLTLWFEKTTLCGYVYLRDRKAYLV